MFKVLGLAYGILCSAQGTSWANLELARKTMADLLTQSQTLCQENPMVHQRVLQLKQRLDAVSNEARNYYDARSDIYSDQQRYQNFHSTFVIRYDQLNAALDKIDETTRSLDELWAKDHSFTYEENAQEIEPEAEAMVQAIDQFLTALRNFQNAGHPLWIFYLNPKTGDLNPEILRTLERVHHSQFVFRFNADPLRLEAIRIVSDGQLQRSTVELWRAIQGLRGQASWVRAQMAITRNLSEDMFAALTEFIQQKERNDRDLNEEGDNLVRSAQALVASGKNACQYAVYQKQKLGSAILRKYADTPPAFTMSQ